MAGRHRGRSSVRAGLVGTAALSITLSVILGLAIATGVGAASDPPSLSPDPAFVPVGLTDPDRVPALARLAAVTEAAIAGVVARPPDAWGVTSSERLALAEFLLARRTALLAHYQSP